MEGGHGQGSNELPDVNLELQTLPSADSGDPGSSRTQSLDMETLLAHAEQPSHVVDGSTKPEPSNRCIKRIRLSGLESLGLGTNSANVGEKSCHENSNLSSRKVLNSSKNTEQTADKLHGKELIVFDNTTALGRFGESSSMDTAKKGKDRLTSSESWIRRWCRDRSQKKPDTVVISEPQSSKLEFENLQQKQFPSIAAMALMGKAMNGFQSCELQKRGSCVVWNTRVV